MQTKVANLRLPVDLLEKSRKHAAKKKTTLSELIRGLLSKEIGYESEPVKVGRPRKEEA